MVRVSCVIPAYNEATTVADVVRAARACAAVDEVIVVSDGSTDATPARAAEAGADRVLRLPRNLGKGAAVVAGVRAARGDIILLLDADLCHLTPDHVGELARPVLAGEAQMAVAVFADDYWHEVLSPLSGQRAVRRALLAADPELERAGFGFEMALDRLAKARGASTCQVEWPGVSHRRKHRKYGMVRGLSLQLRASTDLMRQARAVHPRRPARPPQPGRHPRMEALLLVLVLLLVATWPLFLAHPSQAAALHLPTLQPLGPGDRLLVVVAHPDDEVIGAGGLIATARGADVPVNVLVVTNGDSNRVAAALVGRRLPPRAGAFIREGRLRQQETVTALGRLGVEPGAVSFLGFPDRQLAAVLRSPIQPVVSQFTGMRTADYPGVVDRGAPYTRAALVDLTRSIIAEVRPTVIITHSPLDRHGDHIAVFDLVRIVREQIPVYTFVVHAPGFPRPLRSSPADPLLPPPGAALPQDWTWMRFELSESAERAKRAAIGAHRSQLVTPYLRLLLVSFVRTNELFAVETALVTSRAR